MFGRKAHLALRDSSLPRPLQSVLRTQEELETALAGMRRPAETVTCSSPPPSQTSTPTLGTPTEHLPTSPTLEAAERQESTMDPGCSTTPCIICEGNTPLQCVRCGGACHDTPPCSRRVDGDPVCLLCQHEDASRAERRGAERGLAKQAEKMLRASAAIDKSPLPVGTNVRLGITYLDQARNQPPNVVAVVLAVSKTSLTRQFARKCLQYDIRHRSTSTDFTLCNCNNTQ